MATRKILTLALGILIAAVILAQNAVGILA